MEINSSIERDSHGNISDPERFDEITVCELGLPRTAPKKDTLDWIKAISEHGGNPSSYYWWNNPNPTLRHTEDDLDILTYPRPTPTGPEHCLTTSISFLESIKARRKILTLQCTSCEAARDFVLEYKDLSTERNMEKVGMDCNKDSPVEPNVTEPESTPARATERNTDPSSDAKEPKAILLGPNWGTEASGQPPEPLPDLPEPIPAAPQPAQEAMAHEPEFAESSSETDRVKPGEPERASQANPNSNQKSCDRRSE